MMLRRRMTRAEKMNRDFMKAQLAEFELPGVFARSAKEHKATPTEKENALRKIMNMKARLKALEEVQK